MSIRISRKAGRACALAAMACALAACGGDGGDDAPAPTGTLTATVVDEFGAPVMGADVAATVGGATRSDATDDVGVATVGYLATGSASVEISLDTFQAQTVTAMIQANQTTSVNVELIRNTQAAGGVFTTNVVGTPSENGKVLTIELQVVVVDQRSHPIDTLTAGDFALPDCTPSNPDTNPNASECVRFTEDAQADHAYTVENPSAAAFALVPGAAPADYAATLMLDQSGSILETDPTNARLFSAKAFMETVDTASGDSVLLTAFAADTRALIPTTPLWYAGTFTSDGSSYFDALDALGTQAKGGTPLYRGLYPEATDPANESAFTAGLIDYVEANAPAGLRKAIVIFTDGEDTECADIDNCRAKRGRVIDRANAADINLFTIGLSSQVDFEALGELARGTDGIFLFADNAEQLIPLYGSLGDLLSRSLPTYTMQWTVRSDTDGTFVSGHSVFGSLQIDGGGSPVTVPFIVGIP